MKPFALFLSPLILMAWPALAEPTATAPSPAPEQPVAPLPAPSWLDAVRAQRMARFEHMQQQHEATLQRMDEKAKAFRDAASRNRPLSSLPAPSPQIEQRRDQLQREREARDEAIRKEFEQRMQDESLYFGYPPPFGLAYPWYYRGY